MVHSIRPLGDCRSRSAGTDSRRQRRYPQSRGDDSPIYGTTTAFALDNVETIRTMSGEGSSRTVGMLGVGSTVGLFQQSFAAGIAGYGLFAFGIALVIAAVGGRTSTHYDS